MSRKNKSEFALLSLLSKKEMSGYDIKQMANKVAAFHWSESSAQIYPILEHLEKKKYVQSRHEAQGERQRKIYSITPLGCEYLRDWIKTPTVPSQYREDLLLKVSAAELVEPDIVISQLQYYKEKCEEQLKEIEKIQKDLKDRYSGARLVYLQMVYDFSKLNIEAKISWCSKNLNLLRSL